MIYSAKGQFLFIHISRCAGTMISNTLYKHFDDCEQVGIQHAPCVDAMSPLGQEFENLFKFCVVRNPWARMVSWYELVTTSNQHPYPRENKGRQHFTDFLEHWLSETMLIQGMPMPTQSQYAMISDASGEILVDHVCLYEDIQRELISVGERLDIPFNLEKIVNPSSKKHYSHYYSDRDRKKVAAVCSQDIEVFGYQFEDERD